MVSMYSIRVWVFKVCLCVNVGGELVSCQFLYPAANRLILKQMMFWTKRLRLLLTLQTACATSETHSHLLYPLFLHLSLPLFHHHLTILSPFILVFPPISLLWVRAGERRTGGNWCNEFRALMLAEASLPWLLVAINLPHSVRAKCAHNRQRGISNWLPITRLWIKDMERGGRAQYGSAVTFILTLQVSQERKGLEIESVCVCVCTQGWCLFLRFLLIYLRTPWFIPPWGVIGS